MGLSFPPAISLFLLALMMCQDFEQCSAQEHAFEVVAGLSAEVYTVWLTVFLAERPHPMIVPGIMCMTYLLASASWHSACEVVYGSEMMEQGCNQPQISHHFSLRCTQDGSNDGRLQRKLQGVCTLGKLYCLHWRPELQNTIGWTLLLLSQWIGGIVLLLPVDVFFLCVLAVYCSSRMPFFVLSKAVCLRDLNTAQ